MDFRVQSALDKLIVCKSELHAATNEVLGCRRDPIQNLPQTYKSAQQIVIEAGLRWINPIERMYQATVLAEVGQLAQLLFIDHVEPSCGTNSQNYSEVEQIIFLQLNDGVAIDAGPHIFLLLLIYAVILVY